MFLARAIENLGPVLTLIHIAAVNCIPMNVVHGRRRDDIYVFARTVNC